MKLFYYNLLFIKFKITYTMNFVAKYKNLIHKRFSKLHNVIKLCPILMMLLFIIQNLLIKNSMVYTTKYSLNNILVQYNKLLLHSLI
jgi:hypothetical protein